MVTLQTDYRTSLKALTFLVFFAITTPAEPSNSPLSPTAPPLYNVSNIKTAAITKNGSAHQKKPRRYTVRVLKKRPFEPRNYTQGLEFSNDQLLVSSGEFAKSAIRFYQWPDMTLLREQPLPKQLFGEGLTRIENRLYVLTWRARLLLIFDANSLELIAQNPLPGEGWGITHHGTRLWFSDGSDRLFTVDPSESNKIDFINVRRDGHPVYYLNELEWINDEIWANVYMTNEILKIDPHSGDVTGIIDLTGLLPTEDRTPDTDVLNGIAHNPATGNIWVTGKRWPWLYNIELEETP